MHSKRAAIGSGLQRMIASGSRLLSELLVYYSNTVCAHSPYGEAVKSTSRTCTHCFCQLLLKDKQRAKDHLMLEESLHVKGRNQKQQVATKNLHEADDAD